jgi:hypothetical protein
MEAGLALLLAIGMCVFVPIGVLATIVIVVMNRSRNRHAERLAMIDRGLVPAPAPAQPGDSSSAIGWAVGIVVGGLLWMVSDTFDLSGFGILVTAVGVAYLTRGILGWSRERPVRGTGEGGNP